MAINPVNPGDIGNPNTLAPKPATDSKPGNPNTKTAQAVGDIGNPNTKTAQAVGDIGNPNTLTAQAVGDISNPNNKTAAALGDVGNPNTLAAQAVGVFPRTLVPSLSLDFEDGVFMLNGVSRALADIATYSRASSASVMTRRVSTAGSFEYYLEHQFVGTATNLALWSEDFSNAAWLKALSASASAPVITQNYARAPDGTQTAARAQFAIAADASGNRSRLYQSINTGGDGNISFWVRSTGDAPQIIFLSIAGSTQAIPISVTSQWTRISAYATLGVAGDWGIELRGGLGGGVTSSDILIWGGQLTSSIKAIPYVRTLGATAARVIAEAPRYEFDPATGASLGIRIETAATNLCLQSETFDNASWTKTTATVSANTLATAAVDGTFTADKLVIDNAALLGNSNIRQAFTKAASALTYTASLYCKQAEFNRVQLYVHGTSTNDFIQARFDMVTGTLVGAITAGGTFNTTGSRATIRKMPNGWYRFGLTLVSNTDTALTYRAYVQDSVATTGDGASGIFIWGAQLEQSPFMSSYIPTSTAAVSRAKDVLKGSAAQIGIVGQQTLLARGRYNSYQTVQAGGRFIWDVDASSQRNLLFDTNSGGISYRNGSASKAGTHSTADDFDYVGRFTQLTNALDFFTNRVKVGAATDAGSLFTFINGDFSIGCDNADNNQLDGHIKTVQLFPIAATDAEIATL